MKRIVLAEASPDLEKVRMEVVEVDVPTPQSGEVLVKVTAAPVNPSDFGSFKTAKVGPDAPLIGKEGSGVVVASGGGMRANGLIGCNVGIGCKSGGTWQEYVCVSALEGVFPLPEMPVEDAASFFVNPYTAVGIARTAREHSSPGFVHTAAASQLGQMLVKLCKQEQMTLINVVRRQEQADELRGLGAEHVVVSSKDGWKDELAKLVEEHKITVAFDAIAGDSTRDIMEAMPKGSRTFVYGGLSEKPCAVSHIDLIYHEKIVEGWFLTRWLGGLGGGPVGMLMRINSASGVVNPGLASGWSSSKFLDVKPEEVWTRFLQLRGGEGFTNKKLRIRWDTVPAEAEGGAQTEVSDTAAAPQAS